MKTPGSIKRLLGIGTSVKPITSEDVAASPPNPYLESQTEHAKTRLYHELVKLEKQSVNVRKMLANDALELVAKPGKRR